jgi:hypothetical protein
MVNGDQSVNANPADQRPNMADLVRDLTDVGIVDDNESAPRVYPSSTGAALTLEDLISDDNGEIVFFNDGGFESLSIETGSTVLSSGKAKDHVTAAGDNVDGFNYVTFENGMTLYFEGDLNLILPES